MATQAVAVPKVSKGQIAKATKLLLAMGGKLTNRLGYNAYVVAMAIAPGTQAQINALAQLVAKLQGSNLPNPIPITNPNLHFANTNARNYHALQKAPSVMGVPFAQLQPQCVAHGQHYNKCGKACTFGLYASKQGKMLHTLVAQGKGSKAAPKAQQQPKAPVAPASTPQGPQGTPSTTS